jgi:putative tryptophan/tyrosine transport system substrate-binding protein
MRRREFITLLGGAAVAPSVLWPLAARAQQASPTRRIGVLFGGEDDDPEMKDRLSWFTQGLGELGWTEGRNLRMDFRLAAGNFDRMRMFAKELVDLQPDVLVVSGRAGTRVVQQQTQTIPIVFVGAGDPVAGGLVRSLSRPEGNTTGVTNLFPSIGGKWLELLKEAVPRVARVALVFNPDIAGENYYASIEAAAAQYAVTIIRAPFRGATELENAISAFATEPNGGLIVLPPVPVGTNRALINRLALGHQLPAMYQGRDFAAEGGLMSYGPVFRDLYRTGASYVDRILRGAKPSDLPVQYPTKYELVVNLKTAKKLGLTVPPTLLARADEVIE